MLREGFCVFFWVKEGRENETQFCCVLMVVCDAGWIMCGDWETQSRTRPAFDGVIFPFSSFPPLPCAVRSLWHLMEQTHFLSFLMGNKVGGDEEQGTVVVSL